MARPRLGAEKREIGVEDLWMVSPQRAVGLSQEGPGLEGKNLISFLQAMGCRGGL